MREILFRGKRKDNGGWVGGYYCGKVNKTFFSPAEDSAQIIDEDLFWYEVIPETVGQYTGLTDKNGKKIFEGDICRNTKTKEVVSVGWHGTMAGYVWSKPRKDARLYDFGELFRAYDRYEVIGNIHDNPEMLKNEEAQK
jgi:uncharacterized phage protein (TIGR01671 family)